MGFFYFQERQEEVFQVEKRKAMKKALGPLGGPVARGNNRGKSLKKIRHVGKDCGDKNSCPSLRAKPLEGHKMPNPPKGGKCSTTMTFSFLKNPASWVD